MNMLNYINRLQKNANGEIDKMNAIAYKTSPRDVQLGDNYNACFSQTDNPNAGVLQSLKLLM